MARQITLVRAEQSRAIVPNRGEGFRLVITASDAVGMPNEIFLYRKKIVSAEDEIVTDELLGICSCVDLITYPVDLPADGQRPAFFRKSIIDVIVPSQAIAVDTWICVLDEAKTLIEGLNKSDYLATSQSVVVGDDIEVSESESESTPA